MSTFNAGAIEASLTLDRSSWNVELRELQAQFEELEAKTITIGFDADTDNFEVGASNVELIGESLSKDDIVIGVDMDSDKFHQGAAQVEIVTDAMKAQDIAIGVETSGVPKTLAELAELETAIEIVDANDINIDVNYDRNSMEKLVGSASGGGGGGYMGVMQILILAAIALSPILGVAIGALSAAVVGFTAALFAALGPLALIIGVMAILIKQFKSTPVKDMTDGMLLLHQQLDLLKKTLGELVHSDVGEIFFKSMATGVGAAVSILHALIPLMMPVALLFQEIANSLYRFVNSKEFGTWIHWFGSFGMEMLRDFVSIGGDLIQFLMNLFIAISPFAHTMMDGLVQDFNNLADWSDNLQKNKGFQDWLKRALYYGPQLLEMLSALFGALLHIGDAIRPFAEPMIQAIIKISDAISSIPTPILTQLIALGVGAFAAWKILVPVFSAVSTALEAISAAAAADTVAFGLALGPLVAVVAAAAAVAAMFIYLYKTNQHLRDMVSESWQQIQQAIAPVVEDISTLIRDNWGSIQKWIDNMWMNIKSIFMSAFIIIHQLVFFGTKYIEFVWQNFGKQIIQIIKGAAQVIGALFKGMFQILAGIFRLIADVLTGKWSHVGADLMKIARGFTTIIIGLFRGFGNILGGLLGIAVKNMLGMWRVLWSTARGLAGAGWNWIRDTFNSFIAWLGGIPGRIGHALAGMWDGLVSGFRNAINTVVGWWNSLSFHIPGFDPPGPGPKFGGFTISPPNLPTFAAGGVVDEPTVAIVGDAGQDNPEIISPEKKMAAIIKKYAGIDYAKMASAIASALGPVGGGVTSEMLQALLEKVAPRINVDASNDDRSARAIAAEMAWELRVLGYGGV